MKNFLSNYEVKVIKFLDGIKISQTCEVDKWSKIETRDDFIKTIKIYIDSYGSIEFNSDYTKFKRVMTYDETIEYFNNNKLNNKREKK
jgi:hypothetical protein